MVKVKEKGRTTTTAAQASSWLYFNYTTNCENLVSLFLSFSFPLFCEPRCTTEMQRNKNKRRTAGTAHHFSPLNRVRWLQHRFASTPDRFSLFFSLLRFLSLSCFPLVFSHFDSSMRLSNFMPDV